MKQFTIVKKTVILFTVILFVAILAVPQATAAFRYLQEGMKIPSFKGNDLNSNTPISSDKIIDQNNMLIVVFWATWSKRSIQELEALKNISIQYPDKQLSIVAINVEGQNLTPAHRQKVIDKVQQLELPFPVIVDADLEIFYQFGVIAVPSTAITDTTGMIRFGPAGFSLTTKDLIVDSIEVLLGIREPSKDTVIRKGYQPNNKAMRYYNLALNLKHQGMYERALSNAIIAIENDSNFPVPYSLIGELYISLDSLEGSIENYTKATELDSNFVAAWSGLGHAQLKNENIDSAIISLEKAIALDNYFAPALLDLGYCFSLKGDTTKASENIQKALELNPKDPNSHYFLGLNHLNNNDSASALAPFIDALELLFPTR